MCNRDSVCDVDAYSDGKSTKRSEPKNQVQIKINITKIFKICLNDLKKYLTTFQGFKLYIVFL